MGAWTSARSHRLLAVALAVVLLGAVAGTAQAAGRCGVHPWCDTALSPDRRADLIESAMSQADKVAVLTGGAASDVGLPKLAFVDGPLGAAADGALFGEPPSTLPATALPAGIALAANFDPGQAQRFGAVVAAEVKHRGFDGDYGPTVNVMRTPLGGRTFEAYGEDPFLIARTAVGWISGAQSQGVMADVKHFAANNQEGQAGVSPGQGAEGGRNTVNANVGERELEEIEFPGFDAAIRQGNVASVMCSYNQVNGTYACDNPGLLQQVLRRQLGFPGIILSDAGAAKTPQGDLNAGMDFDIVGNSDNAPAVDLALATGQVSQATLDARVHEYVRTLFAYGFFDRAAYVDDPGQDDRTTANAVATQTEQQGATLLRNDGVLPLDPARVHSIAVIGPAASQYIHGFGSSEVMPRGTTNVLQGLQARAARAGIRLSYDDGSNPAQAAATARAADVAIVVGADSEGEGDDKLCMSLVPQCAPTQQSAVANFDPLAAQSAFGDQDSLIATVAAANPRTVVVLETGAPVLTPWRDRVAGLLEAWYPGQAGGTAIAHVLFGDVDPGGRLPVTFPRQAGDEPTANDPQAYPGTPGPIYQETYKEGVLVGYRSFDARRVAPAYAFGYGLSYTTFRMRRLRVSPPSGRQGARASIDVTNTGRRAGVAVPELYLGLPQPSPSVVEPPAQLAGFRKIVLAPGRTQRATFAVGARSLSYWDVVSHAWRIAPGCVKVMVGSSSRAIAAAGVLPQGGASCPGSAASTPVACKGHARVAFRAHRCARQRPKPHVRRRHRRGTRRAHAPRFTG